MMKLNTIQNSGYLIEYSLVHPHRVGKNHYFCGPHHIQGVFCPNCQKPLLRFLSIDLRDERLSLTSSSIQLLPMLFCWTCNVAQEVFFYKLIDDSTIIILHYKSGGVEQDFPYAEYPIYFPGNEAVLEEIPENIQQILSTLNTGEADEFDVMNQHPELCKPRHQIGGEPYLLDPQGASIDCPECRNTMFFLGDNRG